MVSHCDKLGQLKLAVPGLGLSSAKRFPWTRDKSRNDWKGLHDLTGLDVCQAWAIVLNAGHLFGTFATERGLLFQLNKDLGDRRAFMKTLCSQDALCSGSRSAFDYLLDIGALHRFHYLLALWVLRTRGPLAMERGLRRKLVRLVCAFIAPPNRAIEQLAFLFRRTRQLVYSELHGKLQGPQRIATIAGTDDLGKLFSPDAMLGGDFVDPGRWALLDTLDAVEADEIFNSTEAAEIVLCHIREFKSWWRVGSDKGRAFAESVDLLFRRPADWPNEERGKLRHYVRLRIPTSIGWLPEVRLWQRDEQFNDPWGDSNFLLTPGQHDEGLRLDIYAGLKGLRVTAARQIAVQLSRALCSAGSNVAKKRLWMTVARFIAVLFQGCMQRGYELRMEPVPGTGCHVGYGTVGASYELARAFLMGFVVNCNDAKRATELRQLVALGDVAGQWRSPAVIMLATARIVAPDGNEVTDLDGLLGVFVDDGLVWTVMETKKAATAGGEAQLRESARLYLREATPVIKCATANGRRAWYFEARSPELLVT